MGWSDRDEAWTFPERDGSGRVIGILRRYRDGTKWLIAGGQRGLYLPAGWEEGTQQLIVPEGASDVAALLSHGCRAVGRPSCRGGVDQLRQLLADREDRVVILGDNDAKPDGSWPGLDGAKAVADALVHDLGDRVRWTLPRPGYKDIRAYLTREADHDER
jgi:hypothetical protein